MKQLFIYIIVLFFCIAGISSCDSTPPSSDLNTDVPAIVSLYISPDSIRFASNLGEAKDTTITIFIQAKANNLVRDERPRFAISEIGSDQTVAEGELERTVQQGNYEADAILETTTTSFQNYKISVFAFNESGNGNYAQTKFSVIGYASEPPEILEVDNPEEVEIPESGSVAVLFTARVTDEDGQDNIENVYLNFRNEDGTLLSDTPFNLLDNGSSQNGDDVAGDSVYTAAFSINSSNTPNNRTALYWAIDQAGLSSDTLTAPFNIVDNQ